MVLYSYQRLEMGHDDEALMISLPFFLYGKSSYYRAKKSLFLPVLNNTPLCKRETIELRRKPSKKPMCPPPRLIKVLKPEIVQIWTCAVECVAWVGETEFWLRGNHVFVILVLVLILIPEFVPLSLRAPCGGCCCCCCC